MMKVKYRESEMIIKMERENENKDWKNGNQRQFE